jgi:maleylpyruvate isomerase
VTGDPLAPKDPLALSEDLRRADDRLHVTIAALDPALLSGPSLLPGWTRGHVLSHLARNADAMTNLLTWARTGVPTPAYPSPEARAAGIEAGAARPRDEQLADIRAAGDRFAAAVAEMPAEAWSVVFDERNGVAAKVVWRRLKEVEIHHVDLGAGYGTADWPESFTRRLLRELVTDRPRSDGTDPCLDVHAEDTAQKLRLGDGVPGITVSGPAHALAGWLSGRGTGSELTVSPPGPLPTLSAWL